MLTNALIIYLFIFFNDRDGRTKPYFPFLIIVPPIADSRNAAVSWNQMPANGKGLLYAKPTVDLTTVPSTWHSLDSQI